MRQGIVQQGASEELAFRTIAHAFAQGLAQSLSDSPVYLSLQEFGIDDPPTVMHSNIAQDFEGTSVTVHFDDSHMRAKAEGVVTQNKMRRKLQPSLYARWQLLALLCCSSHFGKGQGVLWTSFVH